MISGGSYAGCPVFSGYDPLDREELDDPAPSYRRARREAPVHYLEKYGFWEITRRDDVLSVLRDTERFSNRVAIPMPLPPEDMRDRMPVYPFATALLFLDNPEHRAARRLVQAPFTPRQVQTLDPVIRAAAERLLQRDDADRRVEFVHEYAIPLAMTAIGHALGVPERDFPYLEGSIGDAFRIASGVAEQNEMRALAESQLKYWEYLCALVEARREEPRNDFSSVLANYEEDGVRPSTEVVAGHINTILGAGFETSSQMMAFGVRSLLENRDQWELLKANRSLLPGAMEECGRHRTVSKRNFRVALTDVEVSGVRIPEGALVAIMFGSANHDEAQFSAPERFDITRTEDNLSFGRGMHFCLGAPLAKLEMQISLETLLDVAPDMRIVDDQIIRYKRDLRTDGMLGMQIELGPVPNPSS